MARHVTYEESIYEKVRHDNINNLSICIVRHLKHIRVHSHSEFEIIQILEGSVNVNTPTEDFVLGVGDVAIFSRFLPHYLISDEDECTLLLIQVGPEFCHSYFPQIDNLALDHSNLRESVETEEQKHLFEELKHHCFDIAYNYFAQKPGFEFRCISDINRIFGYIISSFPHHFLSETTIYNAIKTEHRMMRILKYIDNHYSEKITLNEIAEMEKISVPYLSQLFHNYLKMTFQEYVKKLRLEQALFLLNKTDLKLYDICVESGFSDPKYLNAAFTEAYGMTPSQYRKQNSSSRNALRTSDAENTIDLQQRIESEECIPILRNFHKYLCDDIEALSAEI